MIKKIIRNIAIFVFALFFVVYFYIQAKNVFIDTLETEYATKVTISDTVKLNCHVLRDETLVNSSNTGTYNYVVSEGEKLGKGQVITNVYSTDSEYRIQEQIQELNSKIDILENSSVEHVYYTMDISKVDSDISKMILEYRNEIATGDLYVAIQKKNELLTMLNKRHLGVNALSGFENIIEKYKEEKETLMNRVSGKGDTIVSPTAGYFFSDVDGYENILTPNILKDATVDAIISAIERKPEKVASSVVGKIVSAFDWYTICIVDKEEAMKYTTGKYYKLTYPYSVGTTINSELANKIVQPDHDKSILVFKTDCNYDSFNFMRNQVIEVSRASYTGLKIKKEALRILDGEEGVYILEGNTVVFKRAEKVYENDGYYIISISDPLKDEENVTTPYLEMYDAVINNGKDLYNGTIIG